MHNEINSAERAKFFSDNCVKLAQFLEELPDRQHNQALWVGNGGDCGTVGCALGWAVQSDMLEGLRTSTDTLGNKHPRGADWDDVGRKYFGENALRRIFLNLGASKVQTINALYDEARRLCDVAHELQTHESSRHSYALVNG